MSLPEVASRERWLAAREELLTRERELTRLRDELNADRRRPPTVEVTKEYVFEGPKGRAERTHGADPTFTLLSSGCGLSEVWFEASLFAQHGP